MVVPTRGYMDTHFDVLILESCSQNKKHTLPELLRISIIFGREIVSGSDAPQQPLLWDAVGGRAPRAAAAVGGCFENPNLAKYPLREINESIRKLNNAKENQPCPIQISLEIR